MNNLHPLKRNLFFYSLHIKNRLYYRCPFLSQLLGTRSYPETLASDRELLAVGRGSWGAGAEQPEPRLWVAREQCDLSWIWGEKIALRWLKGRSEKWEIVEEWVCGWEFTGTFSPPRLPLTRLLLFTRWKAEPSGEGKGRAFPQDGVSSPGLSPFFLLTLLPFCWS